MDFRCFEEENYQAVCDFLIALNQGDKTHINWNWARWEWMYQHPYFERTLQDTIGLWWDDSGIIYAKSLNAPQNASPWYRS